MITWLLLQEERKTGGIHLKYFYLRRAIGILPVYFAFLAIIVFSDEILKGSENPHLKYSQVIRPWKSRLGLFYVKHTNVWFDLKLVLLSNVAILSRTKALVVMQTILRQSDAGPQLLQVAGRKEPCSPFPLPGQRK